MKLKRRIITVANLKGGVGKTTVVINLATSLGQQGHKVLVIDLDFQRNATTGFGQPQTELPNNVHAVLMGKATLVEAIDGTNVKNVDILAGHRGLLDFAKSRNSAIGREYLFEEWRDDPALSHYDFVIFDTHPDMDCLTLSAFVASDAYIVPLFAELDPIIGLTDLFQQIETIKKRYNPGLELAGVVITKFDKTESTHRRLEEKIREGAKRGHYHVFKNMIPSSKRLSSAKLMARPVVLNDPGTPLGAAFKGLAKEVVQKVSTKPQRGKTKNKAKSKASKPAAFAEVEKSIRAEIEAESDELI